jgi:diguanylate cyclase (GGDEF)-like protein
MTGYQPKTILLIEDAAALRQEVQETLECLNYYVLAAEHGAVGVQLAKAYLPDLILCDIMMPEMDGYEVHTVLQQDPNTASIPFIFLSAKADWADVRRGMNLGADDYLTKPFTSEELSEAIAARLQKQADGFHIYEAEMRQATASLTQLAYTDPLTGLPNRIQLYHRLQDALNRVAQVNASPDATITDASTVPTLMVAIAWLSIDNFHAIVDQVGDVTSDWLLKEFANRLMAGLTKRDVAARLNSNEFCVVMTRKAHPDAIVASVELLHECLTQVYQLGSQRPVIHLTVGIALYPVHATVADQLLHYANTAMRYAQQSNGNRCLLYNPENDVVRQQRQLLETHLNTALERSEFSLYYQPQVNLITGRIVAAEALLRWQHPKLGTITPGQFMLLAEERGEMVSIGQWVLYTACTQVMAWRDATMFPLSMCINLSATELLQDGLVERVTAVLQATGCQPDMLCLEITEYGVMKNFTQAVSVLERLKALGIRIAIDDFGTGYSSLNYVNQLPIDILKIDHSTINHLPHDSSSAAIVSSIIALAQSQKLVIVAEGVETQEQLEFLRKNGCSRMQGNLFSAAVSDRQFERLLLSERRLK